MQVDHTLSFELSCDHSHTCLNKSVKSKMEKDGLWLLVRGWGSVESVCGRGLPCCRVQMLQVTTVMSSRQKVMAADHCHLDSCEALHDVRMGCKCIHPKRSRTEPTTAYDDVVTCRRNTSTSTESFTMVLQACLHPTRDFASTRGKSSRSCCTEQEATQAEAVVPLARYAGALPSLD